MIGKSDTLMRFMKSTVNPAVGAGTAAFSNIVGVVSRSIGAAAPRDTGAAGPETDAEMEMRLRPTLMTKAYSENLEGMGTDSVLMMQKHQPDAAGSAGWSDWGGDYWAYVPRLVEALRASGRTLTVDAFHAEKDSMVGDYGEQGQVWFDACWAADRCGDGVVTYGASCVEGADHDLVWAIKNGVPGKVFGKVGDKGEEEEKPVGQGSG